MKKLSLSRETLQQLTPDQLGMAAGRPINSQYFDCGTGPDTVLRFRCQVSFQIDCWVSELYSACCPTTQSRDLACEVL